MAAIPAADTCFKTPFGDFQLRRYPARRQETLQAWNAADSLLLEALHSLEIVGARVLVVNDEHGALCVPLRTARGPTPLWTDSALAAIALEQNLKRNPITANQRQSTTDTLWSTSSPPAGLEVVAMRVPKLLPYFEYQLVSLAQAMAPGSQLLAAGMDKHLSPKVAQLLERYIGPTQRHHGQRKARLFSAIRDERPAPPVPAPASYLCELLGQQLVAMSNVFSQDKLDGGTRLLLAQLDTRSPAQRVLDLACGNGVLGLVALQRGLASSAIFCDESAMAVASARANADALFADRLQDIHFHHGDGLLGYTGPQADLVLCNPPFHLNHTVDEFVGRRLIEHCASHLSVGGDLYLVANRHLNYQPTLKRHFHTVAKIAQDNKFIVWHAVRRGHETVATKQSST